MMVDTLTFLGLFFCCAGLYYAACSWIGRDL
jgi:hypothetical protein